MTGSKMLLNDTNVSKPFKSMLKDSGTPKPIFWVTKEISISIGLNEEFVTIMTCLEENLLPFMLEPVYLLESR